MKRTSGLKLINGRLHAVRYIFEDGLTIKELEEAGIVRLKSGISSRETPKQYRTETIRTDSTGKNFVDWDDNFLDQNLSFEQAADIIPKMDSVFKQLMINQGYHSRTIHNNNTIGTEFYEDEDKDSLIEIIQRNWDEAYRIAYEFVTKTELPDGIEILPFEPKTNQDTLFIDPLVDYFKTGYKATAQSHGGTGKTKMSFRVSEIVCKDVLKKPWKTLMFSDTRANTVQLAAEFAKFYKGQTGKRLLNIYLIGSVNKKDVKVLESWVNVHPISNTSQVSKALIDSFKSKNPCAFFVVNKSADKFLTLASNIGVNFKNWFTALDEIQQYANESDQPKIVTSSECAVVNPKFDNLFGRKLGLSATHIMRDSEICSDLSAVFNDDIEKFGPRVVDIDELTARKLGWISDKQGMIIPLPTFPEFIQSIEEKRPLELTVKDESVTIAPQFYVAVEALIKYILPQNKTHVLLLTPFIKNIDQLAKLFRIFQDRGLIDKEYEIIEGYAKCGNSCVNQFNKAKKSIMIATRWIGVGQDTYKCDCTFPLYNPSSSAFRKQFSMRGDRWGENKTTLLTFVAMEDTLQDNGWFECLENISNGSIPNIISEAEFSETSTLDVIGPVRNPNDGTNIGNVTLIRSTNNDPILFSKWEELTNHVTAQTYTDNFGNSRFSEIFNLRSKYTEEFCISEAKKYSRVFTLRKEDRTLSWFINSQNLQSKAYSHMWDWLEDNRPSLERVKEVFKKYNIQSRSDVFRIPVCDTNNGGAKYLSMISKLGLDLYDVIDKPFTYTKHKADATEEMYAQAYKAAKKYKTLSEFTEKDTAARLFGKRMGILEKMTAHMERPYKKGQTGRDPIIITELTTGFKGTLKEAKEHFNYPGKESSLFYHARKGKSIYYKNSPLVGLQFALVKSTTETINKKLETRVRVLDRIVIEHSTGFKGRLEEALEKFNMTAPTIKKWAAKGIPIPATKNSNPSALNVIGLHFTYEKDYLKLGKQ